MDTVLVLNGLISGAVTVPLVKWVIEHDKRKEEIPNKTKNIYAFVFSFGLALVGYLLLVLYGVSLFNVDYLVGLIALSYTTSQAIYKFWTTKKPKKEEEVEEDGDSFS